jgi:capsule polysaccharide export protein KpsE/RkpR
MSKSLKSATLGLFVAVIGFGCFGGYQLYQWRYLSSDIKRTLTAAMDPLASENDVMAYVRDARLQVHTQKDAEILEKVETCTFSAKDASEIEARLLKQLTNQLWASKGRQQEKQLYNVAEKRAKDEERTAQGLSRELRAELGLPPLPNAEAGSLMPLIHRLEQIQVTSSESRPTSK